MVSETDAPLFGLPMVSHDLQVSLRPAIPSLLLSGTLLYASAISLPSTNRLAPVFRLILLPILLVLAYDLSLNRRYSFGSPFRDMAFPSLGFIIFCRAVDFALVSRWDPSPAFHWIVPDHSSRKDDDDKEGRVRWRKVPHPPLWSTDRLLWALDNLTLLRPGSAWVLPWRVRALEWAQRALESPHTRFGEPEWPLAGALVQKLAHHLCHVYIRHLDLPAGVPLWTQPLHVQCTLTFALGGVVAFSNALEEAVLFPILLRLGWLPRTALIASSQRAITSAGIGELWGKRWHHVWRRAFIRLARLLPGQQNQLVHAFGTFFISATMHCWLLARLYPEPSLSRPLTYLPLIYEPGVYIFFLCQGLGTVLERLFLPPSPSESLSKRMIRLIWLYFVLIGSGRYVTNSLVVKGLMKKNEWDMVRLSNVFKMLIGLVWNW